MEGVTEKFTITVAEGGLVIRSGDGMNLRFTASEALMLLDILENEEQKLRQMAEEASPVRMGLDIRQKK